ncbi:hypothetical protein U0070_020008, partial [Myodes glareolus]
TTLGPAQSPGAQTAAKTAGVGEREEKSTAAWEARLSQRRSQKSTWSSHPATQKMERSTQELFLNFTVVLITVLLMWLLVRSYQY